MAKNSVPIRTTWPFVSRAWSFCSKRAEGWKVSLTDETQTAGMVTYTSPVTHTMKLDWNLGALADGLRCYRSQEFFLAHEHWESVWLKCQEPEKSFLQALIQIAAEFHHLQRNNSQGASSLLKAALRKLEPCPALFENVEVTSLREDIGTWLEVLKAPSSAIHPPLPKIRLTSLSV